MLMARLQPGVSEAQAITRLNPLFQRAAYAPLGQPERGEKMPDLYFANANGIPGAKQAYEKPLRILLAMVGLILLIAIGNVALMLSARNTARQREFSVRLAIGGSKIRLFRQLLAESLLLVAAGTALGYLFALTATHALSSWSELNQNLNPDRTVLLFTLGTAAMAALLFGLAPLRNTLRIPVGLALKTSAATSHQDSAKMRGRKLVVALQICLCLMLVVPAGLLLRTLRNLQSADLGMQTQGLLVFGISPRQEAHSDLEMIRFYESLSNRIRGLPGVVAVTAMDNRLGSGWSNNTTPYVDGAKPQTDSSPTMRWNAVGSGYLTTLGIKLAYGRDLAESDSLNSPKVLLINETFAKRYFKGQNPLGHQVGMSNGKDSPHWTVVGVAADSKYRSVDEESVPIAYFPYKQMKGIGTIHIEVSHYGRIRSVSCRRYSVSSGALLLIFRYCSQ